MLSGASQTTPDELLALLEDQKRQVESEFLRRRPWHAKAVKILRQVMANHAAKEFMDEPRVSVESYMLVGVKSPMWLSKVHAALCSYRYSDSEKFLNQVRLIFQNCYALHPPESAYVKSAAELEIEFERLAVAEGLAAAADKHAILKTWQKLSPSEKNLISSTIIARYEQHGSKVTIEHEATRKQLLSRLAAYRAPIERRDVRNVALPPRRVAPTTDGVQPAPIDDEVQFHSAPEQLPQNQHKHTFLEDVSPIYDVESEAHGGS